MKYIVIASILFFVACSGSANNKKQESPNPQVTSNEGKVINKVITVEEFEQQILSDTNIVLIDVRTPEEIERGYIANAIHLNFYDDAFKSEISELDRDTPTYLYCKSGGRSGKTAAMLKEMGFREVYDLDGGIGAWMSKNKPLTKE